ncbi:MAG: Grx4 family monothiol glutaredoxin [Candidatus Binatia bacterium]
MANDAQTQIDEMVKKNKILIYMKGNPTFPMCGFSAATIQIFNSLGVPYETVDVLEDSAIREGIKRYSSWPTIPQVYINGEFVGGCDIIREMHANGELEPLVRAAVKE